MTNREAVASHAHDLLLAEMCDLPTAHIISWVHPPACRILMLFGGGVVRGIERVFGVRLTATWKFWVSSREPQRLVKATVWCTWHLFVV